MVSFISVILVMVSLYSNTIVTKMEVGTRNWDIAVTGLTMLFFGEL